jgi:hypothetical protein
MPNNLLEGFEQRLVAELRYPWLRAAVRRQGQQRSGTPYQNLIPVRCLKAGAMRCPPLPAEPPVLEHDMAVTCNST